MYGNIVINIEIKCYVVAYFNLLRLPEKNI